MLHADFNNKSLLLELVTKNSTAMKEFILNQFKKAFYELSSKSFNETYQAGLPDISGSKPMKLKFYNDKVVVSYYNGIIPKKFIINPNDIVEVEMGVQSVDNTGKVVAGAIAGSLLAGSLGAIALAGSAGKQSRENALNLIIKYNGENRPLILNTSKNTYKIYQLLKGLKS